ncbi:hypothetical protein BGZ46_010065 [Entomortierella lignicola]|nr:hypothetical protein BGZ46_010065 [Entomortierella lignicola]
MSSASPTSPTTPSIGWSQFGTTRSKIFIALIIAAMYTILYLSYNVDKFSNIPMNENHTQADEQRDNNFVEDNIETQYLGNVEVPYWDASKPLPKWYTETQKFIKRLEEEKRPYPFFDKYMSFDTHIWLGLNNMRYMLEMSNNMARVLERTLIIPSKFFARSCTQFELCQIYAELENVADVTDPYYLRWALDINTIWDVEEIRKTLNVITSVEFNRVMLVKHNIIVEDPEEWISSLGGDLRLPRAFNLLKVYHDIDSTITIDSQPLLPRIYDLNNAFTLVDDITPLPHQGELPLKSKVKEQPLMDIYAITENSEMTVTHMENQQLPIRWQDNKDDNSTNANGIFPLGFKQMFHSEATILHFQEGVHGFGRFPFKFSTEASRERYQHIALNELAPSKMLQDARDYILQKFLDRIDNQPYNGFHNRQGDFRIYGWATDNNDAVMHEIAFANWMHRNKSTSPADCEIDFNNLPREIKAPEFLEPMKSIGGISIQDLIDEEFVRKFLPVTLFGDYLG